MWVKIASFKKKAWRCQACHICHSESAFNPISCCAVIPNKGDRRNNFEHKSHGLRRLSNLVFPVLCGIQVRTDVLPFVLQYFSVFVVLSLIHTSNLPSQTKKT